MFLPQKMQNYRSRLFLQNRSKSIFFLCILSGIILVSAQIYKVKAQIPNTSFSVIIDGNAELEAFCGGNGNGTEMDPFVLDYYNLSLETESGILIKDTNSYLIIDHMVLTDNSGHEYNTVGIKFANCQNICIQNSYFKSFETCIDVVNSNSIQISRNCLSSDLVNIRLQDSSDYINITDNYTNDGSYSLKIDVGSSNLYITGNCFANRGIGISIMSSNATVRDNYFFGVGEPFRYLSESQSNPYLVNNSLFNKELFDIRLQELNLFFANYMVLSSYNSYSQPSSTNSLSTSSGSPYDPSNNLLPIIIVIVVILAISIFLISSTLPHFNQKNKKIKRKRLWQSVKQEYHAQITQIHSLCQNENFLGAYRLYESLRSLIDPSYTSFLNEDLRSVLSKVRFNLKIVRLSNQMHKLLDKQDIFSASQEIEDILREIHGTHSGLFQNLPLLRQLQFLQTELKQPIAEKRHELVEKIEATSILIQTQQYELLDRKFKDLNQELMQWPFSDLKNEVQKRYRIFLNFKEAFHLSEDDSITDYLEELDEDFDEWTSNEASKLGKKI